MENIYGMPLALVHSEVVWCDEKIKRSGNPLLVQSYSNVYCFNGFSFIHAKWYPWNMSTDGKNQFDSPNVS